ncbi:MAG: hypothetical protein HC902_01075 [Calothrix sp. SM1_5_4]|nr:hypothetical protein [Calothrix sp. SM1_5_4]
MLFTIGAALTLSVEQMVLSLPRQEDGLRLAFQVSVALWDLVESLLLILILSWGIPQVRQLSEVRFGQRPFAEPYLGSFLAEYLRAMASVLLWGLLLILPGVVRFCRLIFVPYITLFSRSYREGKVDALEFSSAMSRGRLLKIFLIVLGTTLLQLSLELLPQEVVALPLFPFRVAFQLLSFGLSIWMYSFFYLLFELAMEEHP